PWAAALSGGEDYELCVTVPLRRLAAARRAAARAETRIAVVGTIMAGAGVQVVERSGRLHPYLPGHDHLASRGTRL
ncbi:MAG: thiamine-phosphate kinase, partial [Anaeromyxobacteraceae bacterium]